MRQLIECEQLDDYSNPIKSACAFCNTLINVCLICSDCSLLKLPHGRKENNEEKKSTESKRNVVKRERKKSHTYWSND